MRDPSPYAGQTVKLRADAVEVGGLDCAVVDWYVNTGAGLTWREAAGSDPRAANYAVRRGLGGLPDDDQVLFGRVDGMGRLIHLTEIKDATGEIQTSTGPVFVDLRAVGQNCPACQTPLAAGDMVSTFLLGPGADSQARADARAGRSFLGVYAQVHWACATGDESYSAPSELGRQVIENLDAFRQGGGSVAIPPTEA